MEPEPDLVPEQGQVQIQELVQDLVLRQAQAKELVQDLALRQAQAKASGPVPEELRSPVA